MMKIVVLFCFCGFAAASSILDFLRKDTQYDDEPLPHDPFDMAMAIGRLDFVPLAVMGIGFGGPKSENEEEMKGNYNEINYSLEYIWKDLQKIKAKAEKGKNVVQDIDKVIKEVEQLGESLDWCDSPLPYKKVEKGEKVKDDSVKADKREDDSVKADKRKDDSVKADKREDDSVKADKREDDSVKADKMKDDKVKDGKVKDDKVRAEKAKDDKVKHDKVKDDKVKDDKGKDDKITKENEKETNNENQKKQFNFQDFLKRLSHENVQLHKELSNAYQKQQFDLQDLLDLKRISKQSKELFKMSVPKEFYGGENPKEINQEFFYYEIAGNEEGKEFAGVDERNEAKKKT